MRSFVQAFQTVPRPPGMHPDGVLHARVPLPRGLQVRQRPPQSLAVSFSSGPDARARALPGVVSATRVSFAAARNGGIRLRSTCRPRRTNHTGGRRFYNLVSEGYFETPRLRPRCAGVCWSETDVATATDVRGREHDVGRIRFFRRRQPTRPFNRSQRLQPRVPRRAPSRTPTTRSSASVRTCATRASRIREFQRCFIPYTVTRAHSSAAIPGQDDRVRGWPG